MNDTALAAAPVRALLTPRVLVPLALFGIYVLWGSTYLAIRIAVAGYPPFLMAAVRFAIAGALMLALLSWRGLALPTRRQWFNCFVTGTLLLGFGNGMVCYAEQSVASGIAAVAVASVALFMAIFAGLYGQWPNRLEWIGLLVGFAGVVVLNFGGELRGSPLGAAALVFAAVAWAFGSVWSKHQDMPHPAMSAAAQMLCACVPLGAFALIAGEHAPLSPDLHATLAVAYLIVAGSLLGFSAYIYLLHHTRPALASSYAYVNPPVAVLVGVLLGGESATSLDIIGMIVILIGVAAITLAKTK
ncbi:MAG TPA: drug/metabolite exporter YedA [Rudaea sp.]|jgi:drug/metabolite transporter (DMT)-like permease|uniref:drug/metabolite exporter YedA n=1 Tax=Rudaea sp. TaxID=2136325 RepID=UPI002F93DE9C